jgi:hypothetical protein
VLADEERGDLDMLPLALLGLGLGPRAVAPVADRPVQERLARVRVCLRGIVLC